MGSVVISGATSGAVTLAVPDEAGTRTLTLPATTGTILTNDISQAGDTSAGNAAAVGYTSAEGLILTGQGSTSDVTIKNDADATVISIPTGTTKVGIGTTAAATKLHIIDSLSGGQLLVATSESDNAEKYGTFGTQHYDTDQEPVLAISAQSAASENNVLIGGALGEFNAATSVKFYTAANATTTSGTERMRIHSDGNIAIGTTNTGDNKLTVEGGVAATNGSSLALKSGGGANSRVADLAFYGTFVTPDTDTGQRRTADITSGFSTANWGNEYLAIGVGAGGANDSSAVTTERMRIAGDGKVGIGTNAPETNLHVFKASSGASTDSSAVVHIENSGTTLLQLSAGTSNDCHIAFGDSGNQNIGSIAYANSTNRMHFRTDNAERMRITSGGILQIAAGSASPTTEVFRIGTNSVGSVPLMTASFPGNAKWLFNTNDTAGQSGGRHHTYFSNGGEVGSVTTTTSATAYNTSSDYRLKENIDYTWDATTRLKQLKPARFNFIADSDNTVDGFIAHEVSSVVPEAITGTKDAVDENGDAVYQGIDQSKLVPLLVKTIQELEARITALEAG